MSGDEMQIKGWHLKKEVTIGQIFTIGMVIVSFVTWASSIENRVAVLTAEDKRIEEKMELQLIYHRERFDRYQTYMSQALNGIGEQLSRIEDKLDKKVDK